VRPTRPPCLPAMLDRDPAPDALRATLNAAQARFDLCIVDTPPAAPEWLTEALAAADLALIPVRPSPDDLRAVGARIAAVNAAREDAGEARRHPPSGLHRGGAAPAAARQRRRRRRDAPTGNSRPAGPRQLSRFGLPGGPPRAGDDRRGGQARRGRRLQAFPVRITALGEIGPTYAFPFSSLPPPPSPLLRDDVWVRRASQEPFRYCRRRRSWKPIQPPGRGGSRPSPRPASSRSAQASIVSMRGLLGRGRRAGTDEDGRESRRLVQKPWRIVAVFST
jgi:hypothetical protein